MTEIQDRLSKMAIELEKLEQKDLAKFSTGALEGVSKMLISIKSDLSIGLWQPWSRCEVLGLRAKTIKIQEKVLDLLY